MKKRGERGGNGLAAAQGSRKPARVRAPLEEERAAKKRGERGGNALAAAQALTKSLRSPLLPPGRTPGERGDALAAAPSESSESRPGSDAKDPQNPDFRKKITSFEIPR